MGMNDGYLCFYGTLRVTLVLHVFHSTICWLLHRLPIHWIHSTTSAPPMLEKPQPDKPQPVKATTCEATTCEKPQPVKASPLQTFFEFGKFPFIPDIDFHHSHDFSIKIPCFSFGFGVTFRQRHCCVPQFPRWDLYDLRPRMPTTGLLGAAWSCGGSHDSSWY